MDERKVKYWSYDFIFCEECRNEFDPFLFYCKYCYAEKTDKEGNCMKLYRNYRGYFQSCTDES